MIRILSSGIFMFPDDHYSVHDESVDKRLKNKGYAPAMSRCSLRRGETLNYISSRAPLTTTTEHDRVQPTNTRRDMTTLTDEYTYTDYFTPSSSALDAVYYNEHDKALAVVLKGGCTYRYDNVDSFTWSNFKNAFSKGRFYAKTIKRDFGPGGFIGYNADEDFEEYAVPAPDMGAVGTPKNLTYAPNAVVSGVSGANPSTSNNYFTLGVAKAVDSVRKHEVVFTVDGGDERFYSTNVASVDDAVAALSEAAAALDVNINVKRVVVTFE